MCMVHASNVRTFELHILHTKPCALDHLFAQIPVQLSQGNGLSLWHRSCVKLQWICSC